MSCHYVADRTYILSGQQRALAFYVARTAPVSSTLEAVLASPLEWTTGIRNGCIERCALVVLGSISATLTAILADIFRVSAVAWRMPE